MKNELKLSDTERMFLEIFNVRIEDGKFVTGNGKVYEPDRKFPIDYHNLYVHFFKNPDVDIRKERIGVYRKYDDEKRENLPEHIALMYGDNNYFAGEREVIKGFPIVWLKYEGDMMNRDIEITITPCINDEKFLKIKIETTSVESYVNVSLNGIEHYHRIKNPRRDEENQPIYTEEFSKEGFEKAFMDQLKNDFKYYDEFGYDKTYCKPFKTFTTQIFPIVYAAYVKALEMPVAFKDEYLEIYAKKRQEEQDAYEERKALLDEKHSRKMTNIYLKERRFEEYLREIEDKEKEERDYRR